ncbi:methyltransferase domain-containing protein [Candidatus Woesearchaeota archaeon]|nr:methyltransferase domain-containing protein [Candidatus Woesearchaeota archaeon]
MRLLILKPKKKFVKELDREVVLAKLKKMYVDDISKDFSTKYGIISKKDLKKKSGSVVKSSMGKEFVILDPDFIDLYKRIKRTSQIMTLKDIGYIAAAAGINKKSKVVDAGTGPGGNAIYLAHICKEVYSYDINEENVNVARENAKALGMKNLKIRNKSIFSGIEEKDIDLVVLDLPTPWNAVKSVEKSLKTGGYLVVYNPQITQTAEFVNTISENKKFIHEKTTELIERNWKIDGKVVRPRSGGIGHTGFLSFVRKVQ